MEYMKIKLIAPIPRMNYTAKTALSCTLLLMDTVVSRSIKMVRVSLDLTTFALSARRSTD